MCNNCNSCGSNRFYDGGEFYNTYEGYNNTSSYGCGCGCGCNNGFGDAAFRRAECVNRRIQARRCCEDRAAAQYLRNLCRCNRIW